MAAVGFAHDFPYRISRTMMLSLFYVTGYLFQKYRKGIRLKIRIIFAGIAGSAFYIISSNNSVSVPDNFYSNHLFFLAGAFSAIYFILIFSEVLEKFSNVCFVRHIIYLGRHSMSIVIWHFLAFRIAIILQILFEKADIGAIVAFPVYDASGIWFIIYIFAGIYGSLLWEYVMKKISLLRSGR